MIKLKKTNLEYALDYASKGWAVFPVNYILDDGNCSCGKSECSSKGKHPMTANGFKNATTDDSTIKGWWTECPNANIGIVTGLKSNLWVLDIDPRSDGDKSLEELIKKHGPLPKTYKVNTGGGGEHYYFKIPVGGLKCRGSVLPGIDVKADGGYVVAAGSNHSSGGFYIVSVVSELSEAPEWLISLINKKVVVPTDSMGQGYKNINEGNRNNTLFKLGRSMAFNGMLETSIKLALLEENEKRCAPSLSPFEVESIASNVVKYKNPDPIHKNKINLIKLDALFDAPEEGCDFLVEELLPFEGISLLAGKPKTGKTTLARNLALSVASGDCFLNKKVEKGKVLYFALEEKKSEVVKHFKKMGAEGDEDIYIHASGALYNSNDAVENIIIEHKPHLVIIDPLFRFINVKDGNDYNSVTRSLEPLMAMARKNHTHIMCIHHLSKGERQGTDGILGSTAIFGTVDTALILQIKNNTRYIYSQQRYGENLVETAMLFDEETKTPTLGNTKEQNDLTYVAEQIINKLSNGSILTESELSKEIKCKNDKKIKVLRDLVKEKKLFKIGRGGKGDPFKYSLNCCSLVPTNNKEHQKSLFGGKDE